MNERHLTSIQQTKRMCGPSKEIPVDPLSVLWYVYVDRVKVLVGRQAGH